MEFLLTKIISVVAQDQKYKAPSEKGTHSLYGL